jgi:hypothetical protein
LIYDLSVVTLARSQIKQQYSTRKRGGQDFDTVVIL